MEKTTENKDEQHRWVIPIVLFFASSWESMQFLYSFLKSKWDLNLIWSGLS